MVGRTRRQAKVGGSLTAAIAAFCLGLAALGAFREWAPGGSPGPALARAATPRTAANVASTPPASTTRPRPRHNGLPDPFTLVFLGTAGLMVLKMNRMAHRRPSKPTT
ncbi:MAG TPA: hypothetical protein PKY77_10020 [Phycisphaerae bacterium]|nr:hypothetical protein [Phycisphaerae bacterium]HRY69913.1 hypothetical protein [Phycisphaerae bacterium]HSA27121.1 hypothetical protein [Phycisphaerae bacterium]